MQHDNLQELAKSVYGSAIADAAQEDVAQVLDNLEEIILESSSNGESSTYLLTLDPVLTRNWFLLKFYLIKPREYLCFPPYQKLWNELEAQDLHPRIVLYWGRIRCAQSGIRSEPVIVCEPL